MKKLLITITFCVFVLVSFAAAGAAETKKKLYTASNIWVHKYMKCINYKVGTFIPAGTEVSKAQLGSDTSCSIFIYFKLAGSGESYKICYNPAWHRGIRSKDYKNYLFTNKTFDELVEDLSVKDIDAIKQGKIVVGMSKKAVLISYGRPPEHRTPSLEGNVWKYWMSKRKHKKICFYNDLTIRCSDMDKHSEEL